MIRRTLPFDGWTTGIKLLVLLTLALFPLGLALAWTARTSFDDIRSELVAASTEDAKVAARTMDGLIARNSLALRIATNAALRNPRADPCEVAAQSLAMTPSIAGRFAIRDAEGRLKCTTGGFIANDGDFVIAPGAMRVWVFPDTRSVRFRVGVVGGMVTGEINAALLEQDVRELVPRIRAVAIRDGQKSLDVFRPPAGQATASQAAQYPMADKQLTALVWTELGQPRPIERVAMFLPLLMWVVAALLSWYLVRRLLLVPLGRLERAVTEYQPGEGALVLPERIGTAHEIRSLGAAFERAVDRLESADQQMAEALNGQRRLVREVHHRVKNNLQVIASLLNIHGRSATTPESRAAYAAIGRRVDALSVVHRNHFAEVEESRGIALRPLLTELGQILRASSPESAPAVAIRLDADVLHTTQDAAVAVAFFVTELIEYAMLRGTAHPIEIDLRRASELAATLTVSSDALVADGSEPTTERLQFERVINGLARQLRSPLEQKLGRLSVTLPVFPD